MNVKTLNELSLLNTALSGEYSNYLTSVVESSIYKKNMQRILNLYAAYCYVVEQGNYNALNILNDSTSLNKHFQLFIGYVYGLDNITIQN
ncbi:hypothetical protein EAY71_26460, partial [Vibrio anguillarum]|nr:hypothetical protein [Vibrio anguillarum]